MEDSRSNDDALNRRLKNRERQRRYRARKRQEADSTNADTTIQHHQAFLVMPEAKEVQMELSQVPVKDMSRIYCKRNWKKDARLAHLSRKPKSGSTSSTNSPVGSSHESEAPHLLLQLRGESPFGSRFHVMNPSCHDNTETKTSAPIRRDWKAEARHKTE